MEFLINNSGTLIILGFVILLIIIGYFADKRDRKFQSQERVREPGVVNDNTVSENSINTSGNSNISDTNNNVDSNNSDASILFNDLPGEGYSNISNDFGMVNNDADSLNDSNNSLSTNVGVQNEQISDFSSNVDGMFDFNNVDNNMGNPVLNDSDKAVSDTVANDVSSNIFSVNDFENIGLNLSDLEKKNYDESGFNNSISDSGNNSSLDDSISSSVNEVVDVVPSLNDDLDDHLFDSEVSISTNDSEGNSLPIEDVSDSQINGDESNNFSFSSNSDTVSGIPEIVSHDDNSLENNNGFNDQGSSLSFDDDSLDDDIWKF